MSQNRNKLIDLFIGNISNSVVHIVLERAIDEENIRNRYNKELSTSLDIAKRYREKVNPPNAPLPDKDVVFIKLKFEKMRPTRVFSLKAIFSKNYLN